jgi:hypothetical protein
MAQKEAEAPAGAIKNPVDIGREPDLLVLGWIVQTSACQPNQPAEKEANQGGDDHP